MAKSVFNIRVEADEYGPLEDLLYKAGYENELLEEYEGDGQDDIVRGIKAIKVWLVNQTQNEAGSLWDESYKNETIYVCSTKEEAVRRARELNKEYGHGCIFTEDKDFVEIDYEDTYDEGVHYYTVECMTIDKPMAFEGV